MTVKELYKYLNSKIPSSLSCDWDNDGLMCCPDGEREAKKILICLDVTEDAIDHAVGGGFDAIVSHHPFIFKGLKSLDESSYIPHKAMMLIKSGVSVMSFHTRLDAADGGVNDTLASLLGLCEVEKFGLPGEMIGRIGSLKAEISVLELARKLKDAIGAPVVFLSDAKLPAKRIALLGGSGKDFVGAAMAAGADTYISGEIGHHMMSDAPDMGINLIEAGHFYTEAPVCSVLEKMIKEADSKIECEIFDSNRVMMI